MLKEEKGENFIRIISQFIEPLNIVSILNDSRTKANKGGKVYQNMVRGYAGHKLLIVDLKFEFLF